MHLKRQLRYIQNHENSVTRVSVEQFNAEHIFFIYSDVVLPYGEPIHSFSKYAALSILCDIFEKDTKLPKWSCVFNCCSECPGVFVPDEEMNNESDVNLPFVRFHHY